MGFLLPHLNATYRHAQNKKVITNGKRHTGEDDRRCSLVSFLTSILPHSSFLCLLLLLKLENRVKGLALGELKLQWPFL